MQQEVFRQSDRTGPDGADGDRWPAHRDAIGHGIGLLRNWKSRIGGASKVDKTGIGAGGSEFGEILGEKDGAAIQSTLKRRPGGWVVDQGSGGKRCAGRRHKGGWQISRQEVRWMRVEGTMGKKWESLIFRRKVGLRHGMVSVR